MLGDLVVTVCVLNVAVFAIAFGIFTWFGKAGLDEYGTIVIYCAFALSLIGAAFANGPSAGAAGEAMSRNLEQGVARHDRADRESALSLGLVIFLAAILAGMGGYLLTRL